MIETIWWIIVFAGAAGGLGFIITSIRDWYYERKWSKQWLAEYRIEEDRWLAELLKDDGK